MTIYLSEGKRDILGKILRIQMLGGFAIYYGGEAVILNKAGSSKSIRLLQMLLLSLPGGISKSEVMDNLYGWNEKADMANRNKNLNNLIYRLKGQLIAGGLPEEEYAESREGMCYFKCSIPLELDIWEFEESLKQTKKEEGPKKISLLSRAVELYRGELIPSNASDTWFFQKSRHYKRMYLEAVQELESEFQKNRDYKNRLDLYARVVSVYPFENWQLKLMRCNLELYRYDEALAIYNNTVDLYNREMGTPPTREMQECFESIEIMDENHQRDTGDVKNWRNMDKVFRERRGDIRQAIFEEEHVAGAYYCAYPSFVDYCRLVVRAKERNRCSSMLMFLTLSRKKKVQRSMDLREQMELLKKVIGSSLRIGDAYTRYGDRHFILMMVHTELEFSSTVFQRVESAYTKAGGKGELWYYADMTQELNHTNL